jgi:hypothetical protein
MDAEVKKVLKRILTFSVNRAREKRPFVLNTANILKTVDMNKIETIVQTYKLRAPDDKSPRKYLYVETWTKDALKKTMYAGLDISPKKQIFDVITAYATCFNGHNKEWVWRVDEWRFFY